MNLSELSVVIRSSMWSFDQQNHSVTIHMIFDILRMDSNFNTKMFYPFVQR